MGIECGRAPFSLSDDQARSLMLATAALSEQFPLDRRGHRPFIAGFMRAVYEACGRTFSPSIYSRLLAANAAGRSPSNTTLTLEKKLLEERLVREAAADGSAIPSTASPGNAEIAAEVRRAIVARLPALSENTAARAPMRMSLTCPRACPCRKRAAQARGLARRERQRNCRNRW